MIEFHCSCGEMLRVPESLSDQEGACPRCGEQVRVPISGLEGWSRLIVVGLKEPILAWSLMTDHPDIQGRTVLPGQVNFTAWMIVWIGLGAMIRQHSPELGALGWNRGSSLSASLHLLAAFVILNFITVHFCWAMASAAYFRFTGRRADVDRSGFADAGGYDLARWIPLITLLVLFVVYRATWSPTAVPASSGLRQPWVLVLLIASSAPPLTWLTAQLVFGMSIGRSAAVEGLIRSLDAEDPNVRFEAAQSLARWKNDRAVRPLMHALSDSHDNVRWAAAYALGKLGDRRAEKALQAALGDRKESVAREARQALQRIHRQPPARRSADPNREARWEKVKVFISSTFNDMHAERDFLVKSVLPRLREWCARRRLLLIDVDLRWGVTERDATHNRNVVRVCLDRIDECQPFFLCFVGQRRGWVPGPDDVSPETLERFPGIRRHLGQASVTELEILHAVLDPFYQRALDVAQPAISGGAACFYLRDPTSLEALPHDPPQLRRIYLGDDGAPILRQWREETIPRSGCPVRVYKARWDRQARTPELALSLECPFSDPANQDRWRAQWAEAGINCEGRTVVPDSAAAEAFNEQLCGGRLTEFMADENPLADVILEDLQRAIIARFPGRAAPLRTGELAAELELHAYYLALATEAFIERPAAFERLDACLETSDPALTVLAGAGGLGKSMLLANWIERRRRETGSDKALWIFRFLGISDASSSVDSLLTSVLMELRERSDCDLDIPIDGPELHEAFRNALREASGAQDVVLVVDGLDRLDSRLEVLGWLMIPPPEGVRFIVSVKSDDLDAQRLLQRWRNDRQIRIIEMAPIVDVGQRRQMVQTHLSLYLKELDEQHQETLAAAEGAENPLFLRVVLEELRVFGSFANLRLQIQQSLGTTPDAAFHGVLRRIEHDPAYTALEPRAVVPIIFGALAHARRGLHTAELVDLIEQHYAWPPGAVLQTSAQRRAAATDAVHFYLRQARPFLIQLSDRVGFYYHAFRAACLERYGPAQDDPMPPVWHRRLVDYFIPQPLLARSPDQPASLNIRKLEELPWQLAHAGLWPQLNDVLADLAFLDAKCRAGKIHDLIRDFALVPGDERSQRLRFFHQFIVQHRQIFARDGTLLIPFACNYASSGPVVDAAEHCLLERGWDAPWVRLRDRPPLLERPALVRTLEGHTAPVTGVAVARDRRIVISADAGGGLRAWDLATERLIRHISAPARGGINKVAVTPDASLAVTAHADGAVRVWHVDGGSCLHTLAGHRGEVTAVAVTEDARYVISGGQDATIRVWNLATGRQVKVLKGHFGAIQDLALSPSAAILVSGGWDCTVRVWNLASGGTLSVLQGHRVSVRSVAISGEGRLIASSSGALAGPTGTAPAGLAESDVRFWTLSGTCLGIGKGHSVASRGSRSLGVLGSAVHAVALDDDGTWALSGGEDRIVCVWDARRCRVEKRFHGHTAGVLAAAIDSGRTLGVTGGADGTVRIWDIAGVSPDLASGRRRVQHAGSGLKVDAETLVSMMWSNRRIRLSVLIPLLALAIGAGIVFPILIFFSPAAHDDQAGQMTVAVVATLLFLYLLGWRLQLQGPRHSRLLVLRPLKTIAGAFLRLLTPIFPVVNCPCCGRLGSGRPHFFHCGVCGWHDPILN